MSIQVERCPIVKVDDPNPDGHSVVITIKSKRAGKDRFSVPRVLNEKPVTTDDVCEIGWSATQELPIYATIHERIVGPVFSDDSHRRRSDAVGVERETLRKRQQAPAAKAKTKVKKAA